MTLNLSNMILKCPAVPGILLFIVIYVNDLVAFIFSIIEKNFRIRKRERFEKSLVQRKSTVKAQFSWCDLCGVCDFVCSKTITASVKQSGSEPFQSK